MWNIERNGLHHLTYYRWITQSSFHSIISLEIFTDWLRSACAKPKVTPHIIPHDINHEQIEFKLKLNNKTRAKSFDSEDQESYWINIKSRLPELVKPSRISDFNPETSEEQTRPLNRFFK